jgi:hypothetical protein
VQLHVIQKIWDQMPEVAEVRSDTSSIDATSEHLCVMLSEAAVAEVESLKSMRLMGQLQGKQMMILIDSGSSTSISSKLAVDLIGVTLLPHPLSVKVASGAPMQCSAQLKNAAWEIHGLTFYSDFKVLPLLHFDAILGYDWLEQFSPIKIHWSAKWISFTYNAQLVLIQGILSELQEGSVVQVFQLTEDDVLISDSDDQQVQSSIPPEIQQLLQSYGEIFASKVSYPPPRACNHTIPLMQGATPFSIKSYRYVPALKTEIEKQVQEMLRGGLIQPSTSAFSSPVLLVKKRIRPTVSVLTTDISMPLL